MLIVTNPAANLPEAAIERYGIFVTPQQIVVDGRVIDTRGEVRPEDVDHWVRTAKEHPHAVGTTAAEFVTMLRPLTRASREIVIIVTSRKLTGTHDAAVIAAKTLMDQPGAAGLRIAVADSGTTELGTGLACLAAAQARGAGASLDDVVRLLEAFRKNVELGITVETLDYLVKSGRATAVRAFIGNLLGIRPLVYLADGEVSSEKIRAKEDPIEALCAWLERKFGPGRRIWAGVLHAGKPAAAARLAVALRHRFDVVFSWTRPLSAAMHLHCGPGSLGVAAIPLDALPFEPQAPHESDFAGG